MNPSEEQKKAILEHIRYEIEYVLSIPVYDLQNKSLEESVFLAYLVHVRNLVGFFEKTQRQQDDVLCSDFDFPSIRLDISQDNRKRFGKDIMHLTYDRLRHTRETKPWPLNILDRALRSTALDFVRHIVNSGLQFASQDEIRHWVSLNNSLQPQGGPL
jgi:hypothetical protein